MKPERLLDPAARLRLEARIAEGERAASGELAFVVAGACDAYASLPWRLGVAFAGLALLGLALFAPGRPPLELAGAQALALALGHLATRSAAVRRALLREAAMERRVLARARRAFAESGLARAPGRSGMLLFVALLERRVVLLVDEGLVRGMGDEDKARCRSAARGVATALRRGDAARALEAAAQELARVLRARLPGAPRSFADLPPPLVVSET